MLAGWLRTSSQNGVCNRQFIAGDALLLLMKKYLTNGMHMNEQIDRNDGSLKSAKDCVLPTIESPLLILARK